VRPRKEVALGVGGGFDVVEEGKTVDKFMEIGNTAILNTKVIYY
jgi:hypothetical protein